MGGLFRPLRGGDVDEGGDEDDMAAAAGRPLARHRRALSGSRQEQWACSGAGQEQSVDVQTGRRRRANQNNGEGWGEED